MAKVEFKKKLVAELESLLNENGFEKARESYKGDQFCEFVKTIDDINYHWTLYFLKYGRVDPFFGISHGQVSELYRDSFNSREKYYKIFSRSVKVLVNPKNEDGYFNSGKAIEVIDESENLEKGKSLGKVAKKIVDAYFNPLDDLITKKLDSLSNIDHLLNDDPVVMESDGMPRVLIYSPHFVSQVLSGILVAIIHGRENLLELKGIYLNYLSKFPEGKREDVDQLRSFLNKIEALQ